MQISPKISASIVSYTDKNEIPIRMDGDFIFGGLRTRTHLNADVRWTSANTGSTVFATIMYLSPASSGTDFPYPFGWGFVLAEPFSDRRRKAGNGQKMGEKGGVPVCKILFFPFWRISDIPHIGKGGFSPLTRLLQKIFEF